MVAQTSWELSGAHSGWYIWRRDLAAKTTRLLLTFLNWRSGMRLVADLLELYCPALGMIGSFISLRLEWITYIVASGGSGRKPPSRALRQIFLAASFVIMK